MIMITTDNFIIMNATMSFVEVLVNSTYNNAGINGTDISDGESVTNIAEVLLIVFILFALIICTIKSSDGDSPDTGARNRAQLRRAARGQGELAGIV